MGKLHINYGGGRGEWIELPDPVEHVCPTEGCENRTFSRVCDDCSIEAAIARGLITGPSTRNVTTFRRRRGTT